MSIRGVSDELARQVSDDLRERYEPDDEDIRALGAKLAGQLEKRRGENTAFAERLTADHRRTFDRLGQ